MMLKEAVARRLNCSQQDQAAFVAETMAATRAYKGSGYSWWYFQNGRSTTYSQVLAGDKTYKDLRSNYFGALGFGDGTLPWREKLMVAEVQAYQPETLPEVLPEPPPAYWNWHGLPNNVYRTYHLQDLNQEPVANGIALLEWKYQEPIPPFRKFSFWARAASDQNGALVLHNPDPVPGLLDPEAAQIKIDAPGTSRESSATPLPNGHTFEIERDLLTYSRAITGHGLNNQPGSNFVAFAELNVQDSYVNASGSEQVPVRFQARAWVHVTGETHINNSSEAHIRTARTFPDCSNPYLGMAPQQVDTRPALNNKLKERDSDVRLNFRKSAATFKVYPNPCIDRITLESEHPGVLSIRDSRGLVVQQTGLVSGKSALDTRAWATGLYHLMLEHQRGVHSTSITKID